MSACCGGDNMNDFISRLEKDSVAVKTQKRSFVFKVRHSRCI